MKAQGQWARAEPRDLVRSVSYLQDTQNNDTRDEERGSWKLSASEPRKQLESVFVWKFFPTTCKDKDGWQSWARAHNHVTEAGIMGACSVPCSGPGISFSQSCLVPMTVLLWELLCLHLSGDNISNTGSGPKETEARHKWSSEIKVTDFPQKGVKMEISS